MRTTNRASRRTPRRLSSRNAKTPTNETSRPDEHEGRESTHAYDRKSANARQDQTPRQLNGRKQKPHADTPKTTRATTKTPRQAERHNRACPGETDPKTHNAGALCTSRGLQLIGGVPTPTKIPRSMLKKASPDYLTDHCLRMLPANCLQRPRPCHARGE